MTIKHEDCTVYDVVRLKGLWLADKPDQLATLAHIHKRMCQFGTDTSAVKLLPTFGSGYGKELMSNLAEIDKIIFGIDLSTALPSDEELAAVKIVIGGTQLAELLRMRSSRETDVKRAIRRLAFSRELFDEVNADIITAMADSSGDAMLAKLRAVESTSSFMFLRASSSDGAITFIQREPTVLTGIHGRTGDMYSVPLGRFLCRITFNLSDIDIKIVGSHDGRNVDDHIHPNVNAYGTVCWGTGSSDAALACGVRDFAKVLQLTDRVLRTNSIGSPYRSLETFADASRYTRARSPLTNEETNRLGLESYGIHDILRPIDTDNTVYCRDENGTIVEATEVEEFPLYRIGNGFVPRSSVELVDPSTIHTGPLTTGCLIKTGRGSEIVTTEDTSVLSDGRSYSIASSDFYEKAESDNLLFKYIGEALEAMNCTDGEDIDASKKSLWITPSGKLLFNLEGKTFSMHNDGRVNRSNTIADFVDLLYVCDLSDADDNNMFLEIKAGRANGIYVNINADCRLALGERNE